MVTLLVATVVMNGYPRYTEDFGCLDKGKMENAQKLNWKN
jgi:hypothetical protein